MAADFPLQSLDVLDFAIFVKMAAKNKNCQLQILCLDEYFSKDKRFGQNDLCLPPLLLHSKPMSGKWKGLEKEALEKDIKQKYITLYNKPPNGK